MHTSSFEALKSALSQSPVLALPDFSKKFAIETDASGTGIGAVLLQSGHPLAFISKALGPRTRGLSAYEKEYLAILLALQQWRPYLQYSEFLIFTDQRSLTQLTEQRLNTPYQQKLYTKLLGLQYQIIYKKGSENRVADALSRKPSHESSCAALSVCQPSWLQSVVSGYQTDVHSRELVAKLLLNPTAVPHFSLVDGVLRYKNRIWIGDNSILQKQLLTACHSSALGGHSGVPVTYIRMRKLFAWTGLKAAVTSFVQSCLVCQQAKPDRARLPGLLQPLPIPDSAWQVISMDFVEGLPTSGTANCILVVIDSFTKYGHFIPLKHPFTAASVAKAFLTNVYCLHGMPTAIISDRDRVFTSHFWQHLFKLADVQLRMSSSYHPQSDGQTERLNQTMETFLRCFVQSCPSKWLQWLPLAAYWYNNCTHSAIGRSPFEALYGYTPRHFGVNASDAVAVPDLSQWVSKHHDMEELIKQHLSRSKERMKRHADKHRSERVFQVGDQVFLKIQPYVQASLAPRMNQKLAFKYFGPYRILERVGSVAYRLELPSSSSIHPVFHVSQLKAAVLDPTSVVPTLPTDISSPRVPHRFLQRRLFSRGDEAIR